MNHSCSETNLKNCILPAAQDSSAWIKKKSFLVCCPVATRGVVVLKCYHTDTWVAYMLTNTLCAIKTVYCQLKQTNKQKRHIYCVCSAYKRDTLWASHNKDVEGEFSWLEVDFDLMSGMLTVFEQFACRLSPATYLPQYLFCPCHRASLWSMTLTSAHWAL